MSWDKKAKDNLATKSYDDIIPDWNRHLQTFRRVSFKNSNITCQKLAIADLDFWKVIF